MTPPGGVAQLGEHLPCKQGVKGSNPFISKDKRKEAYLNKKLKRKRTKDKREKLIWAHSSAG